MDRRATTNATGEIDHYLATDADGKGTAIVDVIRQLTVPPLQELIAVDACRPIAAGNGVG